MRILTISRPIDAHVAAVDWALRSRGIEPVNWFASAYPVDQSLSCHVRRSGVTASASEQETVWKEWDFDVVWLRRFSSPRLEGELAEVDRPFAETESDTFIRSMLFSFADRGRWINGLAAKERAQHKTTQLKCAAESGLLIPDTLVTNSKDEAVRFFEQKRGKIIAKQFNPIEWKTERGIAKSRTSLVTAEHLDQWRPRELAPTIFQDAVDKAYEVRITVVGDEVIGARLDVSGDGAGRVDWRLARVSKQRLEVSAWPVPDHLRTALLLAMRRLGLVFGCIDAIVTPDGDFYFLEVNEMGQFLWLEDLCPDLQLLAKFCAFLVDGSTIGFGQFPGYADYGKSGHWPAWRSAAEAKYPRTFVRYVGNETSPARS